MTKAELVQVQVRTSKANCEWLKAKAREQDRSVNWIVNKLLEEAREADQTKK